jgi:hypothetical protein
VTAESVGTDAVNVPRPLDPGGGLDSGSVDAEPTRTYGRIGSALTHPIGLPVAAIGLTILPLLLAVVALITSLGHHYAPFGDQAFIELHVRDVGHHAVQVGPFSRFGWSHPGPAIYFLLTPLYLVLGKASQSFAITTLLVNAGCVTAIALIVRRRVGVPAMMWSLAVLAIYLRVAGPLFIRDSWNPILPVLPLALMLLLAWSACYGARWGVPFGAAIASFCVQSHVGFLLAVVATAAVPVVLLAIRLVRRKTHLGGVLARWWLPLLTGLVITVVMWLPPISQQLSGHPGNLQLLWDYFRSATPTGTWGDGLRWVNADIGALPGYLTGQPGRGTSITAPHLPAWTGLVALVATVVALAVAVRRRSTEAQTLLAFAVVLSAAGVLAVHRVVGDLFAYLAEWILVAGILIWVGVGVAVLARRAVHPGFAAAGLAVLAAMVVVSSPDNMRATTPWTYRDGVTESLNHQVLDWLGPDRHQPVRLDFAPDTRAFFNGTSNPGSALALALIRRGVPVRLEPYWKGAYGEPRINGYQDARIDIEIASGVGGSPPPRADQQVIARAGDFAVYGSRRP